jgi:hypothetical protein
MRRRIGAIVGAVALVIGTSAIAIPRIAGATTSKSSHTENIEFNLVPSNAAIASCFPNFHVEVEVKLTTDRTGRDIFKINAKGLSPETSFTVFLLEQPGAPFGAAEYIGDFTTNASGHGDNTFRLIVQEAFASTVVGGQRVRVDLNHVGFWFADPQSNEACLGPGSASMVTPFDGDGSAGVQVGNSANALPGAPLPPP